MAVTDVDVKNRSYPQSLYVIANSDGLTQSEAAEFDLTCPRDAKTSDLTRSQDAEIDLTQHQARQGFANFSALGRKLRYEKGGNFNDEDLRECSLINKRKSGLDGFTDAVNKRVAREVPRRR